MTGEQATAQALKRLTRSGWTIKHNVPRDGRDIDHVLIGPQGAIAVESKYTSNEWVVSDTTIEEVKLGGWHQPMDHLTSCAKRAAHDLAMVMLPAPGECVSPSNLCLSRGDRECIQSPAVPA